MTSDLVQGTLDMLILKILALQPRHGWGISERMRQMSSDVFRLNPGSLYPALQRLQRKGYLRSSWKITDNNRRARFYELTAAGHRQLEIESDNWNRASAAIDHILSAAH